MPRYKFTYLAFSFTLLITFFSIIPLQIKIEGGYNFLNLDKAIHFLIYFTYTVLIFISLEKEFLIKSSKLLSIFISFIVGFSLELIQGFFLSQSMLSRHVEHKRCPFLTQKVFVDLSISFLQIKHLNIGDIQ